jgi:hypothetical protein
MYLLCYIPIGISQGKGQMQSCFDSVTDVSTRASNVPYLGKRTEKEKCSKKLLLVGKFFLVVVHWILISLG